MRIGVATTSYPRRPGDPSGSFVRALCLELVQRGHTCEVLAPDDPAWEASPDAGITVARVPTRVPGAPPMFYAAGAPDNVRRDPRALACGARFVPMLTFAMADRARGWDAVLSHWALPCALAARAAFGAERHVAVWHSADVQLANRLFGRAAWPMLRGLAREHVFVAAHLRERLGAAEDPRAHVIPMGIARHDRPAARPEARPVRALVLARLVPVKRVELAIAAAESAGLELLIAGEGPERGRLERFARASTTRFVGAVDEAARARLFAQCEIFLATSAHDLRGVTEGYPVAPREALAHGLVVLATDDPVHRELARRCGGAVVLSSEAALSRTLSELARDRQRLRALARLAPESVGMDAWPCVAARFEPLLAGRAPREEEGSSATSQLDTSGLGMG